MMNGLGEFIGFACIFLFLGVSCDDMIDSIAVPRYSFSGSRVNVSCSFHIDDNGGLYSLKWYHNETEFYRYVPTEKTNPVIIKPSLQFNAYEISRLDRQVILGLTRLTSEATGEYKCEVISEHPTFMTEFKAKNMVVIEEPPTSPVIEGWRTSYDRSNEVNLQCFSKTRRHNGPTFKLTWYINGSPAPLRFVTQIAKNPVTGEEGVELSARANEIVGSSMSAVVECHLKLGDFDVKASEPVSINVRKSNYLATFWSAGTSQLLPQLTLVWGLLGTLALCFCRV